MFIDDATLGASSSDSWVEKVVISMLKIPQWSNLDLVGTDLTDANLGSAKLNNANLTGAFLDSASLTNATYDSATIWPTAENWIDTTCPDGSNSEKIPKCGF